MKNGTFDSPGLACGSPASSHACTSEGVSPALRILMVTSCLAAGYTTRVPLTTMPAVAHGTAVRIDAATIVTADTRRSRRRSDCARSDRKDAVVDISLRIVPTVL